MNQALYAHMNNKTKKKSKKKKKKNENLSFLATQMKLDVIKLSEISQKQKTNTTCSYLFVEMKKIL
jgi:hypothetical protein